MVVTFFVDNKKQKHEKWKNVEVYYKHLFPEIKQMFLKLYSNSNLASVDFIIKTAVNKYYDVLYFKEDLEYFAEILQLEVHVVLAINLFYEMTSACTTICTKIKNTNVMFRTMDWDLNFLNKISFNMKTNNYDAITWFGCVGLFTASNDNYAIAINYRRTQNVNLITFISNSIKTISMHYPASYLVRYIFDNNMNIYDAFRYLKYAKLISPVYFTLCPRKFVPYIITRSCDTHKIEKCKTYLCQTNIDSDLKGDNILWSIERIKKVSEIMANTKFNSPIDMLEKITDFPIVNHETLYVSVLVPGNDILWKTI